MPSCACTTYTHRIGLYLQTKNQHDLRELTSVKTRTTTIIVCVGIVRWKVFRGKFFPENNNIMMRSARWSGPYVGTRSYLLYRCAGSALKAIFQKAIFSVIPTIPRLCRNGSDLICALSDFLSTLPNYIAWYVSRRLLVYITYTHGRSWLLGNAPRRPHAPPRWSTGVVPSPWRKGPSGVCAHAQGYRRATRPSDVPPKRFRAGNSVSFYPRRRPRVHTGRFELLAGPCKCNTCRRTDMILL